MSGCYCDSVIIKLLINFSTVGSIGMSLSGVARLMPGNFWVGGWVAECDVVVVVGCILFGMNLSQSKNALLLNLLRCLFLEGIDPMEDFYNVSARPNIN